MRNIYSSLLLIQLSVYIELIALFYARSERCCNGLLQALPIHRYTSGENHGSVKPCPIYYSSKHNYLISTKSGLQKEGGISYRQSVCTTREMNLMQTQISAVMKNQLTKEHSSIAQNRLGATLTRDQTGEIFRILEEGSIFRSVQRLANSSYETDNNRKIELSRDLPVEVRVYEQVGASMAWHRDDIMYDPPQLEVVFTLENNSDCVTMWKVETDSASKNLANDNEEIHCQETLPNAMLLLLAGGPEHCVTSLKRGRRVILKCAYVYAGATYLGEEDYRQFGKVKKKAKGKSASNGKKRKRNRKR